MESNVFTIVGNRMKGRRCCWSIRGANNLANLLCLKHTMGLSPLFADLESLPDREPVFVDTGRSFSASKMPKSTGNGAEFYKRAPTPDLPWLRDIAGFKSFTELNF